MTGKKKNRRAKPGFTMVELMAMLIIIGLLATLVVMKVATKIDQARVTTTKANLKALHAAVNQFKMDTSRFPTEEEGLRALIEQPSDVQNWEPGGYLETTDVAKDGWGREFVYQLHPEGNSQFVIVSYGADGEEGGEGYDADLYSTDAY
jgi:general secretion pathway protein G